jgi:hypothetical protein
MEGIQWQLLQAPLVLWTTLASALLPKEQAYDVRLAKQRQGGLNKANLHH